jgi:asparagine synthase (glutamine-hydrolysing)
MGIKPLYFAEHEGRLYFASEIRGLLLHSRMPRQVDLRALDAFMTVGFVPAPYTLFKGIKKLPAAHYLMSNGGQISIKKYWELSYECDSNQPQNQLIDEFKELLHECVRVHLISEVPLGALLSGGIDSVTIIALMQSIVQSPVKTINISFQGTSYDEAKKAEVAARALGTDHHSVIFSGDSLNAYPRILFYREEPIADPTFTALYYLFQACREHNLTVVLSGEGADELLGGYYWHRGEHWVRPLLKLPYPLRVLLAKNPVIRSRAGRGRKMENILCRAPKDIYKRYLAWISIGDRILARRLLSSEVNAVLRNDDATPILESWADYLSPVAKQPVLDQMLWLQSRTRLVDWINHGVDRMSMAHSVEARPPFLDHKLWEFCARVPHKLKLHGSYFRLTEKYLLREAGRNLVPQDVRVRKKKPLLVPYGTWLSRQRLPDWAETALSDLQLKKVGFFDTGAVDELRKHHQAGAPGRATLLMGILCIQTWAHLFLESPLEAGPP